MTLSSRLRAVADRYVVPEGTDEHGKYVAPEPSLLCIELRAIASALEEQAEERAFLDAAMAVFEAERKWGLEDMRVAELFDQASQAYRALLASRKP